jgi:hypothetical protein
MEILCDLFEKESSSLSILIISNKGVEVCLCWHLVFNFLVLKNKIS